MFFTRTQPLHARAAAGSPLELFNRFINANRFTHHGVDFPPFNLWGDEEGVVLTSELPGVKLEDLDISVSGKNLTIKGSRKADEVGEQMKRIRHERMEGDFERTFQLPFTIETEKVQATLKNGVLTVVLPRAENEKPRKITVSA